MMKLPWIDPIDPRAPGSIAVYLVEYACDGRKGRPERGDAVYDAVTEHRDTFSGYSSCADLAHWMLYRLGIRLGFINRVEHKGWQQQVNLSRLAYCQQARSVNAKTRFSAGDIIIQWNKPTGQDGHVMCVIEDRDDVVEVAQYGSPGGSIVQSPRTIRGNQQILGKKYPRVVQKHLPLLSLFEAASTQRLLVDAEDVTRNEDGSLLWSLSTQS